MYKYRQLKFRAWDDKNKKWLFGYEYQNLGGFSLTGEVVLLGEISTPNLQDWNHINIDQFTGLEDKNGKEIYEGDILQGDNSVIYSVFYDEGAFMAKVESLFLNSSKEDYLNKDAFPYPIKYMELSSISIIGNIHENSNLLNK